MLSVYHQPGQRASGAHGALYAQPNGQGGADFTDSQGTLALSIGQETTSTTVASLHPTGTIGQGHLFTAWVAGGPAFPPTGTVAFYDPSGPSPTLLGTVPLGADGQARWIEAGLIVGMHPVAARYSGDGRYLGSQSAPVSQSIRSCTVTAQLSRAGAVLADQRNGRQLTLAGPFDRGSRLQITTLWTSHEEPGGIAQFCPCHGSDQRPAEACSSTSPWVPGSAFNADLTLL